MEIKYSVIIPVYNSEKTIDRCVKSLLSQQRNDVEIIVINDGSKDKSEEILSEYEENNQNIVLISQENRGVSAARNAGIEKARGIYITFVDGDDYVSDDYFAVLDQMAQQPDEDLIIFSNNTVGGQADRDSRLYHRLEHIKEKREIMRLLLSSRKIMSPWNKRFKKNIIEKNNIRFIKYLQTGEDFNFCLEYMLNCNTIGVKYKKIYNVDISDNTSLSRKYRAHLDVQLKKVFKNAASLIRKSNLNENDKDSLLIIVDYLFVKNVFTCIAEEFKCAKPSYRKVKNNIGDIYKKFCTPLCRRGTYCNVIHRILRVFIQNKCILPVYGITKLVKGKRFARYMEE